MKLLYCLIATLLLSISQSYACDHSLTGELISGHPDDCGGGQIIDLKCEQRANDIIKSDKGTTIWLRIYTAIQVYDYVKERSPDTNLDLGGEVAYKITNYITDNCSEQLFRDKALEATKHKSKND